MRQSAIAESAYAKSTLQNYNIFLILQNFCFFSSMLARYQWACNGIRQLREQRSYVVLVEFIVSCEKPYFLGGFFFCAAWRSFSLAL